MWVEIFKTGTHADSKGRKSEYTHEILDDMVSLYNSKHDLAPIVKGHPVSNSPAYGWVDKLARRGNKLLAYLKDINSEFASEIKEGRYKKVSISLTPDLNLRHIGFLGAASPAVSGLAPVEFDESKSNSIDYVLTDNSEETESVKKLEQIISELQEKILNYEKAEALQSKSKLFSSCIDKIDNAVGKTFCFSRYDADMLKSIVSDMIEKTDEQKANEITENVANFISSMKPAELFTEFSAPLSKTNKFNHDYEDARCSPDKYDLHLRALKIIDQYPEMNYEDAVCQAACK